MSEAALIYHCINYSLEVSQFSSAKASRLAKEPRGFFFIFSRHILTYWCRTFAETCLRCVLLLRHNELNQSPNQTKLKNLVCRYAKEPLLSSSAFLFSLWPNTSGAVCRETRQLVATMTDRVTLAELPRQRWHFHKECATKTRVWPLPCSLPKNLQHPHKHSSVNTMHMFAGSPCSFFFGACVIHQDNLSRYYPRRKPMKRLLLVLPKAKVNDEKRPRRSIFWLLHTCMQQLAMTLLLAARY